MPELLPPQHRPAVPVTAGELRVASASDRGKTPLVLVPAVIGNAQAAKTAMDASSKTVPSHVASTFAVGQDQVGNAAVAGVAGAAIRAVPMALPRKEVHPGK